MLPRPVGHCGSIGTSIDGPGEPFGVGTERVCVGAWHDGPGPIPFIGRMAPGMWAMFVPRFPVGMCRVSPVAR